MAARRSLREQERVARAAAQPSASGAASSGPAHRPRVLVVEDDIVNRQVVQRLLARQGGLVDTAENGEVGAERAESTRYALIVTDLDMPVLDGDGMLARLREGDGPSSHVPVVAMTAHGDVDHYELSLVMGMSRHLVKPLTRAALKDLLETMGLVQPHLTGAPKNGGFVGPRPPRPHERRRAPTVGRVSAPA